MTPLQALTDVRAMIEAHGPDTSNRHWGRKQFEWLMGCFDLIEEALDIEEVDTEAGNGLLDALRVAAEYRIEDEEDIDMLSDAWLTADDVAVRLRARLLEKKYWWTP